MPVYRGVEPMTLDRGMLAKIDRRVFAGLNHSEAVQLVKVPVPDAMWSTWRRYCRAVGLTMGEAVAGLIVHELRSLVGGGTEDGVVFAATMQRRLVERSEALDARARHLDEREQSLKALERRVRAQARPLQSSAAARMGRNDPCPCGSGFKYKRCHGT
jgi:uncharacterized protein YchJ